MTLKMGSGQSKLKKNSKEFKPLRLTHRRVHSNSSPVSNDSLSYSVDEKPTVIDDELSISISPQNLILIFSIIEIDSIFHFEFKRALHRGRYDPIVEIMSQQILLPLSHYAGIPSRDAIIHMCRDDDLHIRILERQLQKIWFIEDGDITITGFRSLSIPWSFWITDQNTWSTYNQL